MFLLHELKANRDLNVALGQTEDYSELLRKIAISRDKQAFEVLFAHYAPRVKALMIKQGSNPEIAEDLMQETMFTVWNKAEQFVNRRGNANAWIFTIARNKRIDRFRKQGTRHYVDIHEYEIADDLPSSEDEMMSAERDSIVADAMQTLPDDQKLIISMSFADDLSQSQISEKLGIPLGTVKSRMRLAYQKIKSMLEDAL